MPYALAETDHVFAQSMTVGAITVALSRACVTLIATPDPDLSPADYWAAVAAAVGYGADTTGCPGLTSMQADGLLQFPRIMQPEHAAVFEADLARVVTGREQSDWLTCCG